MEPESFSTSFLLVALHCLFDDLLYWNPFTKFPVGLYYLIVAIFETGLAVCLPNGLGGSDYKA